MVSPKKRDINTSKKIQHRSATQPMEISPQSLKNERAYSLGNPGLH